MKTINWITSLLVIIGAINWGLIGFFEFDLVAFLLHSSTSWTARAVYAVVGLSGLYRLKCLFSCKSCH
jgi:uncharacterized membrane protein YuzA (DUF378 family)